MNIFVDSGAFSANNYKIPVVLNDYIDFIKKNESIIELYANLDVIGDAEAGWKNQRKMEEAGLNPLPVFHIEDDIKYLHKCLEYNYFALGGVAGRGSSETRRIHFLDMCFDVICDKNGYPKSQVHGFGLASPNLLWRYPWFSYDSYSWTAYGKYGMVLMPKFKNGKFQYNTAPIKVFVTVGSPKKSEDGMHLDTLSKLERSIFLSYIESKNVPLGKSLSKKIIDNDKYILQDGEKWATRMRNVVEEIIEEGVINNAFYRDFVNYCFYVDLTISVGPYPRQFQRNKIRPFF